MSSSVWGGLIKTMSSYLVCLSKGCYKSKDYIYMVNGTELIALFPVITGFKVQPLAECSNGPICILEGIVSVDTYAERFCIFHLAKSRVIYVAFAVQRTKMS